MKRSKVPIIVLIAVIFSIISVVRSHPSRESTTPPSPPPTAANAQSVAAVGLIEPESENVAISCAVPGLVTGLYAKAGDRVQAGQKLFSLDDRDLEADRQIKRAALEAVRARLTKLEEQPRAEDVPPSEARVSEARANLADAEGQMRL